MVASVNNADRSFAFSAVDAGRAILDKAFGQNQAAPAAPLTPVQQGEQARLVQANAPAQAAVKEFQTQAQQLATRDPAAFAKLLDQSFGTKLDANTRAQLTEMAKAGQLPTPAQVRFVGDDVLGGALGAYSAANGGTIFLNESLKNDPASLKAACSPLALKRAGRSVRRNWQPLRLSMTKAPSWLMASLCRLNLHFRPS
jgi:hypothetical protein